ncbi:MULTISPECIES: hypothetical protein [Dethiosulfovibrio]|uniref:Uncharacterized protein n=3 Tax=Dethiosulfovibrio TaxID=47054 RepID=A0ABS9EMN0_9BACT|nr:MULTISPECIES: hypothetical protein [Dethiosulfovibrio]MCF4114925.1 hypothetical protein [Dethiosulfovibrio russensis]MCF4142446.1 hypothetical protein [Dethiosulfovibrio marinus]MCF4145417.1 hypothetical protein [Dethiosulfovibrio acidaminovorans]
MLFLLSGEGPSDMGSCSSGERFCGLGKDDFRPGPMALFVDKLADIILNYSPLETYIMAYVSEKGLGDLKEKGRKIFLSGSKAGKGNAYFRKNAFLLGRYALEMKEDQGQSVVAILFRDCDGTRSSPRSEWDDKRKSIVSGFKLAGLRTGVAMVPKTKSECWLLCAVQEGQSYRDCARFEELSGNDSSEKGAPKKVLREALGEEGTSELLNDLIRNGTIDPIRIDMPSFNAFKEDFEEAIRIAMKE